MNLYYQGAKWIYVSQDMVCWSSFVHSPVTSSILAPNILLNALFSNTLSLHSSLNGIDQVSHPHKTTGKCPGPPLGTPLALQSARNFSPDIGRTTYVLKSTGWAYIFSLITNIYYKKTKWNTNIFFLPLLKLFSKILCHVFIATFGFGMQHFPTGELGEMVRHPGHHNHRISLPLTSFYGGMCFRHQFQILQIWRQE